MELFLIVQENYFEITRGNESLVKELGFIELNKDAIIALEF